MSMIEGESGSWEVVIGLEVHAQVTAEAKLFSGASTEFGAEPNSQVSLVDAAMPGMLPVINGKCVEQAVRTGLGLRAEINLFSVFDRKNYFYPDLPHGYQISQYGQPVVGRGEIVLDLEDGAMRTVGITRIHLEQDAGKSLHDQDPKHSFVDLNRAGVALMEIVSEPDLRSAAEAATYLTKLRAILRYLGTCDGNMEQGSLRCDANVSVRRPGDELGTRCEIKNVNSIRFVRQAIDYEARRQIEVIEGGGAIVQETRLFDSEAGVTRPMRGKEEAHDYRYFPDPDLLPLELDPDFVERIRATLPELPDEKKARFIERYSLTPHQAELLVAEKDTADAYEDTLKKYFEKKFDEPDQSEIVAYVSGADLGPLQPQISLEVSSSASSTANAIISNVFSVANARNESAAEWIQKLDIAGMIALVNDGTISNRIAKDVFDVMVESGRDAAAIVEEGGLTQLSDTGEIEQIVDAVIAGGAQQAEQFRAGNEKVLGWFVGQVMKATGGKANPQVVNEILRKKLAG